MYVQPIIYDGTCNACNEGYINCCDNNGFVGLSGKAFLNIDNGFMLMNYPQAGGVDSRSML